MEKNREIEKMFNERLSCLECAVFIKNKIRGFCPKHDIRNLEKKIKVQRMESCHHFDGGYCRKRYKFIDSETCGKCRFYLRKIKELKDFNDADNLPPLPEPDVA